MWSGVIAPIVLTSGSTQGEWSAPVSLPIAEYLLDVPYLIQ